jgi:hypothetical protein
MHAEPPACVETFQTHAAVKPRCLPLSPAVSHCLPLLPTVSHPLPLSTTLVNRLPAHVIITSPVLDVDALGKVEGESWVYKGRDVFEDDTRVLLHLSRGGADATVVREFNLASKVTSATLGPT